MFLPVLLVRDFGLAGFLTFAIPNCLGAAAMGFVLRDPAASTRLVHRHLGAMRAFSLVTIAFHVFFLAWLGSTAGVDPTRLIGIAAGVSAVVAVVPGRAQGWLALGLWALVALVIGAWATGTLIDVLRAAGLGDAPSAFAAVSGAGAATPMLPVSHAAFLAPVCVFGFLLCPYLDLTFHRARQATSRAGGKLAFSLGFLGLFPTMIVFTLAYAAVFLTGGPASVAASTLVLVHIAVQAGYTVGVHVDALRRSTRHAVPSVNDASPKQVGRNAQSRFSDAPTLLTTVLVTWLVSVVILAGGREYLAASPPGERGLGETIYRSFMAFYGLIFPAHVWLIMLPAARGEAGATSAVARRGLRVLVLAVIIAGPMYWLGFNAFLTWWLVPGLGVVLLARLAIRGRATSA
jgi:hypothetical protein